MKAFAGVAAFGLVPVPTMPASYTYERNCDHRSTTTGDVNTSPLMVLPDYITERIASRDEFTRILARVLTRRRVWWPRQGERPLGSPSAVIAGGGEEMLHRNGRM